MNVNTQRLRRYLNEKWSAHDLETFLFDYFPRVSNDITPGMSHSQRVQLLLEGISWVAAAACLLARP